MEADDTALYLAPAEYVDSDAASVRDFAAKATQGCATLRDRAVALFQAAREIYYAVDDLRDLDSFRASGVLAARQGYCVGKASLLAAACRAAGIPARVAFADVTNHLTSPRLREAMGTDTFAWHGYTELMLDGRWLKVTPTFNSSLCAKMRVAVLEFDGAHDALLQSFDEGGRQFMRYLVHHGHFHDVPAKFLSAEMQRLYPKMSTGGAVALEKDVATA